MSEPNDRVEWLLQFTPLSKADREYLEAELISEIEIAEREKRVSDAIRLRRRLAELRGIPVPQERPQTEEQRALEEQIEKAQREGRIGDAIKLKRRRAGLG